MTIAAQTLPVPSSLATPLATPFDAPPAPPPLRQPLVWLGLLLGCALAPLLAYNQTPSATLYNQLLAFAGFGLVLMGLGWGLGWGPLLARGVSRDGVTVSLWLMLAAALTAPLFNGLPWSMALTSVAMLVGALLVLQAGWAVRAEYRSAVLTWFCLALVLAGLLSTVVSLLQVFMPEWTDGRWVARSGVVGRAVGNMRQPNHLASLLMWACVAAVWLHEGGWLQRRLASARAAGLALGLLLFAFVFAVLLSASRTGMLGVGLLALWGLADRRLTRASRIALGLTLVMLAASWGLVGWWTHASGQAFGAEARLAEGAGSPSRLQILANAWGLLQRNPWTGVGWGDFNLAWTLTPFPGRPVAFFDHTHNLPMQLLVELGWPLGLLVLGSMAWGVWQGLRNTWRQPGVATRCAFMLVAMIGLHSLLEYPLWYAYFLLPAAFAMGLSLGVSSEAGSSSAAPDAEGGLGEAPRPRRPLMPVLLVVLGGLMVVAAPLTVVDYHRVVAIYSPPKDAAPLSERMAAGQRSWFFSTQADYAAATVLPPGEAALEAAQRTGHHLIDVRLMMAWSRSLDAVGRTDQARYLAQRLAEFRNVQGNEWLDDCLPRADGSRPFQCAPPTRAYDFRELRGPR